MGDKTHTNTHRAKFYFSVAWSDLQLGLAEKSEFVLPSGQQIVREKTLPPDLAIINQRIEVIFSFFIYGQCYYFERKLWRSCFFFSQLKTLEKKNNINNIIIRMLYLCSHRLSRGDSLRPHVKTMYLNSRRIWHLIMDIYPNLCNSFLMFFLPTNVYNFWKPMKLLDLWRFGNNHNKS